VAENQPERAAGVPASGVWNAATEMWEVCAEGAEGVREGECLRYRPDGTLYSRSQYVAGLQEGAFTVFHPNGKLAREGTFAADRLDGPVMHYVAGPGGEPFRACCVPPNSVRMLVRYQAGDFLQEVFFDADGRAL
jgi:MORN repeat variant